MKNIALLLIAAIGINGCDDRGANNGPSAGSNYNLSDAKQVEQVEENNSNPSPSEKSITVQAVDLFNMLLVESVTHGDNNRIDEIAASLGWDKQSDSTARGGNAQTAYLALMSDKGAIFIAHQGNIAIWTIAVAKAFREDIFYQEVDKTLSLEKLLTDQLPGQETTYYIAREKKSSNEIGVIVVTTSDHPTVSGHGSVGWISSTQWKDMNSQ